MSTLVINLTRFGDLIQTQPVLAGLAAAQEPVSMVCLENFAQAARLLDHVDTVRPLPGAVLLAKSDQDWPAALSQLLDFVHDQPQPRHIVNLTPSLSCRLLTRLLGSEVLTGYGMDEHGFGLNIGTWSLFLQAASINRGASPFNLVDVFRRVAGQPPAGGHLALRRPADAEVAQARQLLLAESPAGTPGFLGLQLGASMARRRWPTEYFVAMAGEVHRRSGLIPVLLGSKGEAELARQYADLADHPFVNLVGRTDLFSLAAAVAALRLLVSNDTGTMHLAAGLGVPVAGIFLATAQPWDTGPYQPGSLSLEPDLPCHPCDFHRPCEHGQRCLRAIKPEVVTALVSHWLAHGHWPTGPADGARVWRAEVDPWGYLDLVSLSGAETRDRARWVRVQRHFYRQFLDGLEFEPWPADRPLPGEEFRLSVATALDEACGLLTILAGQGQLLGVAPRPAIKAKFMATWQRLSGLLAVHPRLNAIGTMLGLEAPGQEDGLGGILGCFDRYAALLGHLRQTFAATGGNHGTEVD